MSPRDLCLSLGPLPRKESGAFFEASCVVEPDDGAVVSPAKPDTAAARVRRQQEKR